VSDWIDSSGDVPGLCTDDGREENEGLPNLQRPARRFRIRLTIGFAVLPVGLASRLGPGSMTWLP
jgi:hypothetical protein